jgi:hypothetical protein
MTRIGMVSGEERLNADQRLRYGATPQLSGLQGSSATYWL